MFQHVFTIRTLSFYYSIFYSVLILRLFKKYRIFPHMFSKQINDLIVFVRLYLHFLHFSLKYVDQRYHALVYNTRIKPTRGRMSKPEV